MIRILPQRNLLEAGKIPLRLLQAILPCVGLDPCPISHMLDSMLHSQNLFPTKTGLFLIPQGSIQHSAIFTLPTAHFLAEDKGW